MTSQTMGIYWFKKILHKEAKYYNFKRNASNHRLKIESTDDKANMMTDYFHYFFCKKLQSCFGKCNMFAMRIGSISTALVVGLDLKDL